MCVCGLTQSVQVSLFVCEVGPQVSVWFLGMLLFVFAGFGIFVPEDEVQLIIFSTFVWSKHDSVRSLIHKLILQESSSLIKPKLVLSFLPGCW